MKPATIKRIVKKNLNRFRILSQIFFLKREAWTCPIIHVRALTKLPRAVALPLLCGPSKGKLRCPANLSILLIHTYDNEPIMETSLRYTGISNFHVVKPKDGGPWLSAKKLRGIKTFLESEACNTEYILYVDSDDAIIRDDPMKAVQYLHDEECEMLMSNTHSTFAYECMRDVKNWADDRARDAGVSECYINAGVFVGKADFVKEVINKALTYITGDDLPRQEYWDLLASRKLCERLPDFPRGVGSDQVIIRYLHPHFYPRLKIDYKGRLALR